MIERWHRTLKTALMCHNSPNWANLLPTVLLGLRIQVRLDTGASPAEFLFGTTLRIPGEFVTDNDFTPDPQIFVNDFRTFMKECKPIPVTHKYKKRAFCFEDLTSCTHVFLRNEAKQSLERPYSGPHQIIERISDKVFAIDVHGRTINVSVERLKPAYFIQDGIETPSDNTSVRQPLNAPIDPPTLAHPTSHKLKTYSRAKKRVHFSPNTKS
ncbi:uncharacterized protein [Linepithema humile]|uniref:uncharacterized protein n=1 Tax=Linepithema humile TaxID=83485 RepID=UPI00351E7296